MSETKGAKCFYSGKTSCLLCDYFESNREKHTLTLLCICQKRSWKPNEGFATPYELFKYMTDDWKAK